ncbi:heterokaryon incompatibility protein-domain-containing protein [Nemania sp. FL0031]|nr:heterokaryon incompatibility protein-domain-containing protein [Nemania sp. FL0031]
MFIELGQVEDRGWLVPSCLTCPPPPHVQRKPTYEDLRQAGEKGCGKCALFTQAILAICAPGACLPAVEWSWNYSVLTGRDRSRSGRGETKVDDLDLAYEIEFFIHPDSKRLFVPNPRLPTEFHVGYPVPKSTDFDETLSRIRSWYSTCVEFHDNCKPDSEPYVPTRLLDIQSPLYESRVRLLETQIELPDTQVDYVCLSHCWAKSRPDCITLRSTLDNNIKGIRWEGIPKTFQDVIEVLRRLHFRYLWIDSICIIQDDADDWTREAAAMCNVYSQAAITLAATNSPDSHHGLHSVLSQDYRCHEFSMALNDGITNLRVWGRRPIPHFANSETHNMRQDETPPLLKRGWVLQERLLSRRVVHFANAEVTWECLDRCQCQCLGADDEHTVNQKVVLGAFLHGPRTQFKTEYPAAPWFEIVEEYTNLALTFAKDRFPALSGAAQRSRQFRGGDKYVAGLWESEIAQGLAWCACAPLRARPKEWVAPTWSWAAVDSRVAWPGKHLEVAQENLALVEANSILSGPDPTGRLTSARIAVRGPATPGILIWENMAAARIDSMFSLQIDSRKIAGYLWPDYAFHMSEGESLVPHMTKVLWLAVLDLLLPGGRQHEYTRLVLRQSIQDPQEFERIGILRVENKEDNDFMMERATCMELIIT